jgi:hypothetical protein
MTVLIDPKKPHPFTPAAHISRPEGERVTYLLQVPTAPDRPLYRRARVVAGARTYTEFEIVAGLADAVREVNAGDELADERERALELVEAQRQKMAAWVMARNAGDVSRFNDPDGFMRSYFEAFTPSPEVLALQRAVVDGSARYASMLGDRLVFREMRGLVAARLFLVGWEGLRDPVAGGPAVFGRGVAGVPVEVLSLIPTADLEAIGDEIDRLLEPGDSLRGNSRSPSSTPSSAKTSTARKKRPAKTRSRAIGGTSQRPTSAS